MVDLSSVVALPEAGDWPEVIPRIEPGTRFRAGPVDPGNNDAGVANWQAQLLAIRTRELRERIDNLETRANQMVTVGAAGDFETINDALSALSQRRSVYVPGGFTSTIRLLPGFVMAEQVLVSGMDLSWITIDGDDAETLIDRIALIQPLDGGNAMVPAFGATYGGSLPRIGQLFTMSSGGSPTNRCGIVLARGGRASVAAGAGIRSSGHHNIIMSEASHLSAQAAIFTGAEVTGLSASGASTVNVVSADVSGCGNYGIEAANGAIIAANSANLSGCGAGGMRATNGARIAATGVSARSGPADAPTDIQVALGGEIRATGAIGGNNVTPNTITSDGLIVR